MIPRALVITLLVTGPLAGQELPAPSDKPLLVSVASWGKFATLGVAAGFLVLAAGAHSSAEDTYATLLARCQADPRLCVVGGTGTYLDPASEALYQDTRAGDADARRWLIVSQVALGVSAVLWIVDLTKGGGDPDNIPYVPLRVSVGDHDARIGLAFRF